MASTTSTQLAAAAPNRILTPIITMEGHDHELRSISYFPDGKRMISGAWNNTIRRWDLQAGKEIEDVRDICEWNVRAVAISRDGRWVITAGGDEKCGELKA
jgi:WD40 repeat protein